MHLPQISLPVGTRVVSSKVVATDSMGVAADPVRGRLVLVMVRMWFLLPSSITVVMILPPIVAGIVIMVVTATLDIAIAVFIGSVRPVATQPSTWSTIPNRHAVGRLGFATWLTPAILRQGSINTRQRPSKHGYLPNCVHEVSRCGWALHGLHGRYPCLRCRGMKCHVGLVRVMLRVQRLLSRRRHVWVSGPR